MALYKCCIIIIMASAWLASTGAVVRTVIVSRQSCRHDVIHAVGVVRPRDLRDASVSRLTGGVCGCHAISSRTCRVAGVVQSRPLMGIVRRPVHVVLLHLRLLAVCLIYTCQRQLNVHAGTSLPAHPSPFVV